MLCRLAVFILVLLVDFPDFSPSNLHSSNPISLTIIVSDPFLKFPKSEQLFSYKLGECRNLLIVMEYLLTFQNTEVRIDNQSINRKYFSRL